MKTLTLTFAALLTASIGMAGDTVTCPMHEQHMKEAAAKPKSDHSCPMHDSHMKGVEDRGDAAMGFSHEKTAHHFRIAPDGGSIEVTANDPSDTASVAQIRAHLREISTLFAGGDFDKPELIHAREVPGTEVMARRKDSISYKYEEIKDGARVVIRTSEPNALVAVHEFLKFQITDHATGDPSE